MYLFFRRFLLFILVLGLVFFCFVYWASSAKYGSEAYVRKMEFKKTKGENFDSTFNVITYNIGYLSGMTNNLDLPRNKKMFDVNLNRVEEGLRKYNPDFVALQEVDFGGGRAYQVNQFEQLAKRLDFVSGGMAVNWDKNYVPFPYSVSVKNHFGNVLSGQGILSKFPILKHEVSVLDRPDNPFWYDLFYIDRLVELVEVEIDSQYIYIMNVHLEAYDKETRQKQSEIVLEQYKKLAEIQPTLLVGDFNSEPFSYQKKTENPTINVFTEYKNLVSACPKRDFNSENSYTYPADSPSKQIDYIFYDSTKIEKLGWKVIKDVGSSSDHLPLLMTFRLK